MKKILILIALLLIPSISFALPGTVCKKVTWVANTETDLGGYYIYWSVTDGDYTNVNRVDVGNVTEYTLDGSVIPMDTHLVLTAYDTSGNESDFSLSVFYSAFDNDPPATPGAPVIEDNMCLADLDMDGDVDGRDLYACWKEFPTYNCYQ